MIIDRYLLREIVKPLGGVCAVLVAVFVGYTLARYLTDAVDGLLPARTVLALVLLRTVVAIEVLLPITLFLSIVMALGRLHSDYEMIALSASGVHPGRVAKVVLGLAGLTAVVAAALSLFVRPWAYDQSYRLRARAAMEMDVAGLEAGRFFERRRGTQVVFVERYDRPSGRMEGVFLHEEDEDTVRVTYTRQAFERFDAPNARRVLVALDGRSYRIRLGEGRDRVLRFERVELALKEENVTPEYRRKAAPTAELARSSDRNDLAELQWRLTVPVSTVLLGLLGMQLSRTAPRRGKNARFGAAVLVYAVYYNAKALAKTLVGNGTVGLVPGLLWVDALLAALVAATLWRQLRGTRWEQP
ncbi:MAG: LPS export ABC transporter permease LptF [Candidatus Rokubacteria bacterium]|nr:LPS export ABC transporter permease LptF [Candidatus Rokubacteria bacterium]MBI2015434.1 LPS export ABC transporter permease LptF [Candidatus Rokubacteria bacterium]MBI2491003.1 LPS export ABC transporter permease LptF [Candidatus Rokubacteria bacterium]MBI4256336.1 LPS export ABC transporter permease LptF [Candidatus Rokubacteria bacterium]